MAKPTTTWQARNILTTFCEILHSWSQLQKSLRYYMYYCCNELYSSEF